MFRSAVNRHVVGHARVRLPPRTSQSPQPARGTQLRHTRAPKPFTTLLRHSPLNPATCTAPQQPLRRTLPPPDLSRPALDRVRRPRPTFQNGSLPLVFTPARATRTSPVLAATIASHFHAPCPCSTPAQHSPRPPPITLPPSIFAGNAPSRSLDTSSPFHNPTPAPPSLVDHSHLFHPPDPPLAQSCHEALPANHRHSAMRFTPLLADYRGEHHCVLPRHPPLGPR